VVLTFSDVAADALYAARSELGGALRGLQAILDNAADAIITVDEPGTVLSFNRGAERMFGYKAAEVTGKNMRMLALSPHRVGHDGHPGQYHETGAVRIIGIGREVEGRRKDGTTFSGDLVVSEFSDETGRKFTGFLRDLTERKQAEQRARQHQAELARVLRVRTAGEFGASLAHELNQPLTVIANNLEACRAQLATGPPRTLRKLLAHASTEAIRAAAIVRNFREMFRRTPPRIERIDLRDIIRETVSLAAPEMSQHKVAFQVHLPAGPLSIQADRIQIEQVVLNLVQNAFEAVETVPARERKVRVRAIRVRVSRLVSGEAKVTVEDSGPGIPAEVAASMFEAFFTTKADGLGMGLAIARSIVQSHHGRLWIERRRRPQGAAVSFSLPLAEEPRRKRSHGPPAHRVRSRR
jgi:two-component system sensor kinase FixL